jgi:hypothetical protein
MLTTSFSYHKFISSLAKYKAEHKFISSLANYKAEHRLVPDIIEVQTSLVKTF